MKKPEQSWLTAYALGELHDSQHLATVEAWLAAHPDERGLLDDTYALGEDLGRAFADESVPAPLGLMPEVSEEPLETAPEYPRFIWAIGLAACLIIMVGGVFLFHPKEPLVAPQVAAEASAYQRVSELPTLPKQSTTVVESITDWPRVGFRQAGETLIALDAFLDRAEVPGLGRHMLGDWLNFFGGRKPTTGSQKAVFQVNFERAPSPVRPGREVVRMEVQAKQSVWQNRNPSNLVIVLDNSATMAEMGRLDLAKSAVQTLLKQLDYRDRVAIIQAEGADALQLRSTTMDLASLVENQLQAVSIGVNKQHAAVWEEAFQQARRYLAPRGNNQIIVLTDGGLLYEESEGLKLSEMLALSRDRGIQVSVFGLGMVNHARSRVQTVAEDGGGVFGFLDDAEQVPSIFVKRVCGSLNPLAQDLQVELVANDNWRGRYELLSRPELGDYSVLTQADWVEPGELWTGLIELDEVEPGVGLSGGTRSEPLTLRLEYQLDNRGESHVLEFAIPDFVEGLDGGSEDFKFSVALAAFAEWVEKGEDRSNGELGRIITLTENAVKDSRDPYKTRFLDSLKQLERP